MIFGASVSIVAAVFALIYGGTWTVEWFRDHLIEFAKAEEPSMVAEFIKAKHRKICPLLDFE